MKVILLADVKSLGKKGEIVDVSDGYARNMILPKKLGVEETSKNLNDLKLQNQHAEKVAAENLEAAKQLAEDLKMQSEITHRYNIFPTADEWQGKIMPMKLKEYKTQKLHKNLVNLTTDR